MDLDLVKRLVVSAVEFDNIMASEIDRVDKLFNEGSARYYVRVDNPLLELPGLAVTSDLLRPTQLIH